MGKTVESYRMAIEDEINRWKWLWQSSQNRG